MSALLLNSAAELGACSADAVSSTLRVVLCVGAAIAGAVFVVMMYSIARFRPSASAALATFAYNKTTEVVWALIPIMILIGVAAPIVKTSVIIANSCNSARSATLQIH